jgi:hypothetical protein
MSYTTSSAAMANVTILGKTTSLEPDAELSFTMYCLENECYKHHPTGEESVRKKASWRDLGPKPQSTCEQGHNRTLRPSDVTSSNLKSRRGQATGNAQPPKNAQEDGGFV